MAASIGSDAAFAYATAQQTKAIVQTHTQMQLSIAAKNITTGNNALLTGASDANQAASK